MGGGGGDEAGGEAAGAAPSPRSRDRPLPRAHQDEGSKQRNRKMFGLLRGTLQLAREESSSSKRAAMQQQKLEKVDAKLRNDRTKLLDFQRSFISERKGSELERRDAIRGQRQQLDERLQRLTWDAHTLELSAFLKTESGPPIYYMPKVHNEATRARLRQQSEAVLAKLSGSPLMEANLASLTAFDRPEPADASMEPAAAADADAGAEPEKASAPATEPEPLDEPTTTIMDD
jgi:hypothetical protein